MRFSVSGTLTFFRKQSFQIRLFLRSGGKTPGPRVSASTGGVYRVCIACGRMCGCETSSSGGSIRRRTTTGRSSRNSCCCRPMLWRHVGVVRPCCAISSDRSRRVGVRCIRSRRLCVCRWSVSIGIGARLARVVVRHDARVATPGASRDQFCCHTPPPSPNNCAVCHDKKRQCRMEKMH